jgi:hypothetical protein
MRLKKVGSSRTGYEKDQFLCPMMHRVQVTREQDGIPRVIRVEFGARPVRLPWQEIRLYLTRWEIEETIRYVKQSYGLENVRVRKYEVLKNLFAILLAVVYFATAWLGQYARHGILACHAITAAKRFFGAAEFVYYAIRRRRWRDIAQTRLVR